MPTYDPLKGVKSTAEVLDDLTATIKKGATDAPPPICEILVPHVCNGMGEPYPDGDYVKLHVGIEREQKWLRLRMSKGAAQLLVAELQGLLGPSDQ